MFVFMSEEERIRNVVHISSLINLPSSNLVLCIEIKLNWKSLSVVGYKAKMMKVKIFSDVSYHQLKLFVGLWNGYS
jgi:hypothetical protein